MQEFTPLTWAIIAAAIVLALIALYFIKKSEQQQKAIKTLTNNQTGIDKLEEANKTLAGKVAEQSSTIAGLQASAKEHEKINQEHTAFKKELEVIKERENKAAEAFGDLTRLCDEITAERDILKNKLIPEDLTMIPGIGKVMNRKLNDVGVYNVDQVASLSPDEVAELQDAANVPKATREKYDWVASAQEWLDSLTKPDEVD